LDFFRAQDLTMRTVPANLGPRQQNLKAEMQLHLASQSLKRLAEELLHLSASQANDMRVLLFQPRFVIVLIAGVVHQVQLIDQPALLQKLEGAVNGNAVQLRITLMRHRVKTLGIEMFPGFVDQLQEDLPLPREPNPTLPQRVFYAGTSHILILKS
jgi:hypothetical protein